MIDPSSNRLNEVKSAFDEYRDAGYQLGITALDVLFCEALLLRKEAEAALELTSRGLATACRNSERLFEAELYRLKARALLVRGGPEARVESEPLLERALKVAREQEIRIFELRAARDLAALRIDEGRRADARELLVSALAGFGDEELNSRDLSDAKTMLGRI